MAAASAPFTWCWCALSSVTAEPVLLAWGLEELTMSTVLLLAISWAFKPYSVQNPSSRKLAFKTDQYFRNVPAIFPSTVLLRLSPQRKPVSAGFVACLWEDGEKSMEAQVALGWPNESIITVFSPCKLYVLRLVVALVGIDCYCSNCMQLIGS